MNLPAADVHPDEHSGFGKKLEALAIQLTGRPIFWLLIVGTIAGFVILRSVTASIPEPPKTLFKIPSFTLTDQDGRPFGSDQLRGRLWVANFIFTSCPTMCPHLTQKMQEIRYRTRNLGDAVHLVSFTVDPERDTPEVLKKYGEAYGAHTGKWSFLTGSLAAIEAAVVDGFKQPIDPSEPTEDAESPSFFDITHGARFVLVDDKLMVRGLYDSTDEGLDEMMRDIKLLEAHRYSVLTVGQRALKKVAPHALVGEGDAK